jgi:tetratricopeptide (TPR) repeat protein
MIGKYNEAKNEFDSAEALKPGYYNNYIFRGAIYYYKKNYAEAKKELQKGLTLEPKSDEGHYYFGWICYDEKNYVKAIAEFSTSITIAKKQETYYARSIAYHEMKEYAKEKQDLLDAILRNKNNQEYFLALADCEALLKNSGEALKAINEALRIDSSSADVYFFKGRWYYETGKDSEAIIYFTQSINIKKETETLLYRADAYRQSGKYVQAITDLNLILQTEKSHSGALLERAICNYYLKKFEMSNSDIDLVLQLNPSSGKAWFYRAAIKSSSGKADACADFKKALKYGYAQAEKEIKALHCSP